MGSSKRTSNGWAIFRVTSRGTGGGPAGCCCCEAVGNAVGFKEGDVANALAAVARGTTALGTAAADDRWYLNMDFISKFNKPLVIKGDVEHWHLAGNDSHNNNKISPGRTDLSRSAQRQP